MRHPQLLESPTVDLRGNLGTLSGPTRGVSMGMFGEGRFSMPQLQGPIPSLPKGAVATHESHGLRAPLEVPLRELKRAAPLPSSWGARLRA
eukprot:4777504-Pyramimonas_sp.AAC.1